MIEDLTLNFIFLQKNIFLLVIYLLVFSTHHALPNLHHPIHLR